MQQFCRRCHTSTVSNPRPLPFTDICDQCIEAFQPSAQTACLMCNERVGRNYQGLDEGVYCSLCVDARAKQLGVEMNSEALKALDFLAHLQERLNEVQIVMQERVNMLNEDITGYVHQRSEHCLALLQIETQQTQARYANLMTRLQQIPADPNDDDEEALEQVHLPGLLRSLSRMVLHKVNINPSTVNQAMTQALTGTFVFFSDIVEIVQFEQRSDPAA